MVKDTVKRKGRYAAPKGHKKWGGRQKGTPNKFTSDVKAALIEATNLAGGKLGMVGYFLQQAKANPKVYLGLLQDCLPKEVTASINGSVSHIHSTMTAKEAIETYSQMINATGQQLIEAKLKEITKEEEGDDGPKL